MGEHSSARAAEHATRSGVLRNPFAVVAFFAATLIASAASAQDLQVIPVGNGLASHTCVGPGTNGTVQSTPGGDDVSQGNTGIQSGANGICETTLSGDDVYVSGYTLGGGLPFQR